MKSMLKILHSRLALCVLSLLVSALPARSATYRIDFSFPIVFDNPDDRLVDPPGKLEFTINVDAGNSKAANPWDEQKLRDAVNTEEIKFIIGLIKEQTAETNAKLNDLVKHAPEATQYLDLPTEAQAQIQVLNSVYKALAEQARLKAELAIQTAWKSLQEKRKELRQWKLESRITIAQNTFNVIWGAAKIVIECAVIGHTAGASTALVVYDAAKTVEAAYDLYQGLRKEFISLKAAQMELMKTVVKAGGGGAASSGGGARSHFAESIGTAFQADRLKGQLELVDMKVIAAQSKAAALAAILHESCLKEDAMREQGDDLASAAAEFASKRDAWLTEIDGINENIQSAAACVEKGNALLSALSTPGTAQVQTAWNTFKEALDTAATVGGLVLLDTESAVEVAVAAVDLTTAAPGYLGKLKAAVVKLRKKAQR